MLTSRRRLQRAQVEGDPDTGNVKRHEPEEDKEPRERGKALDDALRALGQPTGGSLAERRERLTAAQEVI